jgi:hypothetical protein
MGMLGSPIDHAAPPIPPPPPLLPLLLCVLYAREPANQASLPPNPADGNGRPLLSSWLNGCGPKLSLLITSPCRINPCMRS